MKKIKILINMIYPCLLSLFLAYSNTVDINHNNFGFFYWPNILEILARVFFVLFVCGLVAYFVTLVMDLVKFIKNKKGNK